MTLLQVRVAARRQEAQDICSFDLVAAGAAALPGFSPGAHVDVHVPGGLVRQYSLWNDPTEQGIYRIGVLKEPNGRGGSRAMHEAVEIGTLLQVSAPRNQFALNESAGSSLLLAGGIGITPILCMAQALARRERAFSLHYCTRSRDRAAFLERLYAADLAGSVHLHFDDGPASQRLDIDALLQRQDPATHLYVCGPKGFMDAVLDAAKKSGWPDDRVHYEFFRADPVHLEGDAPFEVRLARSGRIVAIPADRTVTQALAEAGVDVPTSCEQGICGTCVTPVLEGTPDHRDSYLMPDEHAANDCFTPCCSRSRSPLLVLDL
ncbi:PDR/VanB family oxidoreductase [Variovorax sp. YR216]|uniref:PDR/VanB family oxidoreductase n=1 Tax=Variovorax sp. YR216 TaxID=1882828 RepID=UPI00089872F0|nr:PDR/VanB family oxidoreductase [Variovorax sp. YR216]SEB08711.1 vanillate O-demethylase ferredoxin subunit [Variovorax sp. YR216]